MICITLGLIFTNLTILNIVRVLKTLILSIETLRAEIRFDKAIYWETFDKKMNLWTPLTLGSGIGLDTNPIVTPTYRGKDRRQKRAYNKKKK